MASVISAGTTSGTALNFSSDTTGILKFQTNGTTDALTINGSQNIQLNAAGGRILNSSGNPILQQTGSVLQVVQATSQSSFSTTSNSYVTSGFSASITPTSSTSKILIILNGRFYMNSTSGSEGSAAIYRGASTNISGGYTVYTATVQIAANQAIVYLDSPATTSSTTYTLYMKTTGNTFNFMPNGATDGTATITLMEIAA